MRAIRDITIPITEIFLKQNLLKEDLLFLASLKTFPKLQTNLLPFRSLTPASTAATIATSDDCGFTNSNESDTYEPIEAFQDFFTAPKASGNPKSAPSDELVHDESKKQVRKGSHFKSIDTMQMNIEICGKVS